ncbi:hypothetical protein Nepgr_017717 [Nepenthes gracilis]|uniref:Uncharacterized protein n=1 Tax=Nepenthes gracilis TaxID=150966 RepID=A0AAD3ST60_NEPGR|nr:hypothetical protein Nepgr_017717 [Nepenthes gracilis]
MASVADIASVLREVDVKALCVQFNIPKKIAWRVTGKDDRAFAPPAGHITVYEVHLRSSLRLPLPDDLLPVLRALRVPIAQLHANVVRYLYTFCVFLRKHSKRLRMSMPLAKDWGQVPEVYTGTPSVAETATLEWLTDLVKENPADFKRDFLVSREETRKVNWGLPSQVQKPTPPARMMRPEESKGLIIRMRDTDEGFIGPLPEKVPRPLHQCAIPR